MEGDLSKSLYVQVGVCTKYVTGVSMNDRAKHECNETIIALKNECAIKVHKMEE